MWRVNPHLWRWLFNAAGAAALLFAAAAVAMWVRCYWATDSVWMRCGGITATVMTARNGCLLHCTGGGDVERPGRHWYRDSTEPSDMIRGNWGFWTLSKPHVLLGVITWGRFSGASEWGMSILIPYWLLACVAAAAGAGPLMIARRLHRRERRRRAGQCVRCGYDLRATPDRCPECGTNPRPPRDLPLEPSTTASSGAVE
jgi:hypothetical protein